MWIIGVRLEDSSTGSFSDIIRSFPLSQKFSPPSVFSNFTPKLYHRLCDLRELVRRTGRGPGPGVKMRNEETIKGHEEPKASCVLSLVVQLHES